MCLQIQKLEYHRLFQERVYIAGKHNNETQKDQKAPQLFNNTGNNLPVYNIYDIQVNFLNSKQCRLCITHAIPKLKRKPFSNHSAW